jgi:hypothetical protein
VNSQLNELDSLVAKLSDGTLTVDEIRRFNDLLKADPIAQECYLDHFIVDGLLEREFSGSEPSGEEAEVKSPCLATGEVSIPAKPAWIHSHQPALVVACLLFLAAGSLLWHFQPSQQSEVEGAVLRPGKALAGSNIEPGGHAAHARLAISGWQGDRSEVVEQQAGVRALDGTKMIRFIESIDGFNDTCDLFQVVDLEPLLANAVGPASHLEASAFFNAVDSELDDCTFELALIAYEDEHSMLRAFPSSEQRPLISSECELSSDRDVSQWQQVTTRIPLPAEVRRVVVRLSVGHESPRAHQTPPALFADNISLHLVKLP